MSLSKEITMLCKRMKKQDKEIRRLKEGNEFLEEASAFSPPAVGSQQKPENDLSGFKNRGRQDYRENLLLLPDAWHQPARTKCSVPLSRMGSRQHPVCMRWDPLFPESRRLFARSPDMIIKCADGDPIFHAPLTVGKTTGSALGNQSHPMFII